MSRASASDWNRLALPEQREVLAFHAEFDSAELAQISQGLVPQAMEDKWFIYLDEDDWLYFHRSWTGACIYAVQLLRKAGGARTGTTWVNRNPEQYRRADSALDLQLLRFLIDALLLGRDAAFPH